MTILYNPFHNGLWLPCKLGGTQPAAVLFLIPEPSLGQVVVSGTPWEEQDRKGNGCPCATWSRGLLQQPEPGQVPAAHKSPGQHPWEELGPASTALLHPIPVQGVTAQEEWGTAILHETYPLHWSHNMLQSAAKISPAL